MMDIACRCDEVPGCYLCKLSPGSGTSMLFHHLVLADVSADGTVVKRDGASG